jgi:hypothetical protein
MPNPEDLEITVQPRETHEANDVELVPPENVGGAAPSVGHDSGGMDGEPSDLAHLSEAEPPEAPEVDAVHIREDFGPTGRRARRRAGNS